MLDGHQIRSPNSAITTERLRFGRLTTCTGSTWVSEQVGVTAATLQAWEGRYSVITPQRTDGYQIYDGHDVEVLRTMKDLIAVGW